jgi:hypothetical protein
MLAECLNASMGCYLLDHRYHRSRVWLRRYCCGCSVDRKDTLRYLLDPLRGLPGDGAKGTGKYELNVQLQSCGDITGAGTWD